MSISNGEVLELLQEVSARRSSAFGGLGLIFYVAPLSLPVLGLGPRASFPHSLPVFGRVAIGELLAEISDLGCSWHDGFHLVDAERQALTHVAQFVSPPLSQSVLDEGTGTPMGARQMTALLTSRLESVVCVALLSGSEDILIYKNGSIALAKNLRT